MIGLRLPDGPLRVVCLGAHPDDIEIGCGGTLLALARRGDLELHGLVLTGVGDRVEEARRALPRFVPGATVTVGGLPDGRLPSHWGEVKALLEDVARRLGPPVDLVLAPRTDDAHQDHRLLGGLAGTVWRDSLTLHYEIPKWDGDLVPPTHYVPVPEELAREKVALLAKSFPSQAGRDWWDEETFLGLMRLRGVECRSRYAEAYHARKVSLDLGGGRT